MEEAKKSSMKICDNICLIVELFELEEAVEGETEEVIEKNTKRAVNELGKHEAKIDVVSSFFKFI